MNTNNKILKASFSLAALLACQVSFADGTDAGTDILNTATLTYSVGGALQSGLSSSTTFKVDKKVDLTVSGITATSNSNILKVAPSSTGNKLNYTLKNEGNSVQKFKIALKHLVAADSVGDTFDAGTTPTTAGPQAAQVCEYSVTPAAVPAQAAYGFADTPIVSLAKDATAAIEVTCSMPNSPDVVDGSLSKIDMLATAVDDSGATMVETGDAIDGSDRENVVDVVLADGNAATTTDAAARNAMHSAVQTFEIDTPMLTVVKASTVISDPINNSSFPKRIPGAIVEYTITIQNSSDKEATGVAVGDDLTSLLSHVDFDSTFSPTLNGGVGTAAYSTPNVTATGVTVPAATGGTSGQVVLTFRVKIKETL